MVGLNDRECENCGNLGANEICSMEKCYGADYWEPRTCDNCKYEIEKTGDPEMCEFNCEGMDQWELFIKEEVKQEDNVMCSTCNKFEGCKLRGSDSCGQWEKMVEVSCDICKYAINHCDSCDDDYSRFEVAGDNEQPPEPEVVKDCRNCGKSIITSLGEICTDCLDNDLSFSNWVPVGYDLQPIKPKTWDIIKSKLKTKNKCEDCANWNDRNYHFCDKCLKDDDSGFMPKEEAVTGFATDQKHYQQGELQPIEVMQATMDKKSFEGYLHGNLLKYALRWNFKGQSKGDLEKCAQYLKWLQEVREGIKINPWSDFNK